jgi:hypothetical protein
MAIDGNYEDDDDEGVIARGKVEAVAGMAIDGDVEESARLRKWQSMAMLRMRNDSTRVIVLSRERSSRHVKRPLKGRERAVQCRMLGG